MKTPKQWYSMKAADKSAEIYIYDEIGSDSFGGVSAKQFVEDLNAIGKVGTINLYINSPGGSVFDGVAIYNSLKRHQAKVHVNIDGMALSIASIIAMAGDSISIAENGMMMIHDPWTVTAGNAADMRKQADILDQVAGTLVNTYTSRTGLGAEEVKALMVAETWLDAAQAVEKGFADKTSAPVKMAAHFDLSRFKNAPREIVAAVQDEPAPPAPIPFKSQIADHENFLHQSRVKHGHPLAK